MTPVEAWGDLIEHWRTGKSFFRLEGKGVLTRSGRVVSFKQGDGVKCSVKNPVAYDCTDGKTARKISKRIAISCDINPSSKCCMHPEIPAYG
jgi:hypothetical protein